MVYAYVPISISGGFLLFSDRLRGISLFFLKNVRHALASLAFFFPTGAS